MTITSSPNIGFPIPGATIDDTRFGDIQAVKAALLAIDDELNVFNSQIVGEIRGFGRVSAPVGWLACDGSIVSRTTYADLFSVVSTLYGAGDGSTTFALPNLINRIPRGGVAGNTGGSDEVIITKANLPEINAADATVNVVAKANNSTTGAVIANSGTFLSSTVAGVSASAAIYAATQDPNAVTLGGFTAFASGSLGGTSAPVSTLPAYTTVLYCIAVNGTL